LLPDALVDTPFGPRQIQHLQKGEIIYGYNEETQRRAQTVVEDIVSRRKDEYLEVELENGHVLKLTPEHLVFTKNRGWVEAQTLTPADDLLGINLWTERGDYIETLIGIYALVNLSNGKMYVGSAFKVADRAKRHFRCLKEGRHSNLHLQAAYNNGDRFSVLLLEKVEDKGKLIAREQYYIDHYHTMDKEFGYNLTPAGRTIITPEGRKRIGLSKKGKTIEELWGVERATQRRAELRSQVGENNPNWGNRGSLHPNYGKTTVERFGPEEAARLAGITSKTHKGRSKDKEHRRKISVAKTGVPLSEPHKAAIALGLADRPPPGPCKEITKQKIKVSLKKSYAEGRCPLTEAQIQARRRNARALHARRMEALHEN
jgi:group I intron endonuclease